VTGLDSDAPLPARTGSVGGIAIVTFDPDKVIEMERRHIREGEVRIVRQNEILERLESRGFPDLALRARALLGEFRDFVEFAKKRLVELERHYHHKLPGEH
jgi:hypothetical protein